MYLLFKRIGLLDALKQFIRPNALLMRGEMMNAVLRLYPSQLSLPTLLWKLWYSLNDI